MENHESTGRTPILKLQWVPPLLLAILLLPVLILLPWQSQKNEFEDHQEQLIADSLWVEQGIRFQLIRNEDHLRFLGNTIIANSVTSEQLKKQFFELIQNHPEIHRLTWLGATDQVLYSTQPLNPDQLPLRSKQSIALSRNIKIPQYTDPVAERGDGTVILMDYHLPLFRNHQYIGSVVASYEMSAILEKMVPWWFAKDNEISLTDIDDDAFALRVDGGYGHNTYTHSLSLDLAGVDLILKINSVRNAPRLLSNYLVAAVMLLGLGLLWSLWALSRDIMRRQAAETALRDQVTFRSAMEKSLVTGLRVRSLDGQLVYVNPAFCEMVGYTEDELIGQTSPLPFWAPEAIETYQHKAPIFGKNMLIRGLETVYKHADGRRIPVLIYESALVDEDGLQTGWMGSILDISDRKQAEQNLRQHEERLQRSARLSTMGELASVMAHELNQPLAAISTYAAGALNMMKKGNVEQTVLEPALVQMQKQAQRAGQIIRSVHDFVVKREPVRTEMQIQDVFNSVSPLIELQAKSYLITVQTDIEPSLPNVMVDSTSLEQVILNLTRNALQSMKELTLPKRILQIQAKKSDDYILVEVIDHGTGISKDVADRLFSPFFSTKAEGMGMGLNICRTIIEFHGGKLTYSTNPTGGSNFCFTLPVIETEETSVKNVLKLV